MASLGFLALEFRLMVMFRGLRVFVFRVSEFRGFATGSVATFAAAQQVSIHAVGYEPIFGLLDHTGKHKI